MIIAGFPSVTGGSGGGGGGGGGLIVSASSSTLSKHGTASSLTTANVTATASGGTSPYTYAWTFPNGSSSYHYGGSDTQIVTANSPTSATTSFTAAGLTSGNVVSVTATVTVTDAAANTATDTVALNFERTGA